MIKMNLKNIIAGLILVLMMGSCANKLDLYPVNDLTPDKAYATAAGYKQVLAKLYGTLTVTGNAGPAGNPDIKGNLDEGSQVGFIRAFFNAQELPTDEAIVAWNDQTIHDFHHLKYTSSDPFILGMYARPIYNITLINEYLRESTTEKVSSRGITGTDAADIANSRAEARFLRAFNYWVMMDLFGKSTFITEADQVGTALPKEIGRTELYNYIVGELKAIDAELKPAKTAEYGRVDQAAAWALLARIYLNAGVYTGTTHYAEAIDYASRVINAGYTLQPDYARLFMADNDSQKDEFIFTINCDGLHGKSYANTTFLVHAACSDDFAEYGTNNGWGGYRATKGLADKFSDLSGNTDKRALFTTSVFGTSSGQIAIPSVGDFKNGLHVKKFVNVRSDGGSVSDPTREFVDTDFPVFRLAEMYLIYIEGVLRGGGGDAGTALEYFNTIRTRAWGGSTAGNITAGDLTLQMVLDERARELYWEGHRRTDLIRYDQLTTGEYLWPWKGGVANGTSVDAKYNLYPIPNANRASNPNLTQNPGF
ncbi:MAG: RagB/SusD domain-containing protein [Candidatus Parvibacillus calidus]|nr:MAG: RagB/SusD domain-containing protein [Candidatus Parvibacillus calidus]WKZ62154.1 MAG: RagB/SusD family nutrient uptake outer membrane protein [Saprospiraceae bacterium]